MKREQIDNIQCVLEQTWNATLVVLEIMWEVLVCILFADWLNRRL